MKLIDTKMHRPDHSRKESCGLPSILRSCRCGAPDVYRRFRNVTYNPRSELTNALMGAKSFSFDFDNLGNRETSSTNSTTFTYSVNALNQYTQITNGGLKTLTYDLDGNTLTYNGWTYSWNGESRLSQATNSSTVLSFKYDFQGRRFQKVVEGVTNSFVYDGWNLVQETSGTNVTRYVWGTDLSQSLQGAGGIGGLLCVIENGMRYCPCFDANGNITEYVDINGTVVAHYEYSAFGRIIAFSGSKKDDFHFRFSTKYYDVETGLYYYGFRYYDPILGRWPSRDPIKELGAMLSTAFRNDFGLSRYLRKKARRQTSGRAYAFARNNPVSHVDILGLSSSTWPGWPSLDFVEGDPFYWYHEVCAELVADLADAYNAEQEEKEDCCFIVYLESSVAVEFGISSSGGDDDDWGDDDEPFVYTYTCNGAGKIKCADGTETSWSQSQSASFEDELSDTEEPEGASTPWP